MVPSDPPHSSFASRHARLEHGIGVRHSACLPRSPVRLLTAPDRCSGSCRIHSPMKPALRNGLSLASSGCPFPDHLSRFKAPSLLLSRLAGPAPGSFGLELPSSLPVSRFGEDHRSGPVAEVRFRLSGWLSGSCSPLGSLDPSGSSLAPVHLRKLVLASRPIASHSLLPESFSFRLEIIAPGSLRFA